MPITHCTHCEKHTAKQLTEYNFKCTFCGHDWDVRNTLKDAVGNDLFEGNTVEVLETLGNIPKGSVFTNIKIAPESQQIIVRIPGNDTSRLMIGEACFQVKKIHRPNEALVPWQYVESHQSIKEIHITQADIDCIRDLIVVWDVAELGAPVLATAANELLQESVFEEEPRKENLLAAFLSCAKLPEDKRTIINPLFKAGNTLDKEAVTYGLTHKPTVKLLENEANITLEISEQLQKLWDTATLNWYGFETKRGFISDDFKAIVDPEGKANRSELIKVKNQAKGELFLYLQLFVQQAILAPGIYHTINGTTWLPGKANFATKIGKEEWIHGIENPYLLALYYNFNSNKIANQIAEWQDAHPQTKITYTALAKHHQYADQLRFNEYAEISDYTPTIGTILKKGYDLFDADKTPKEPQDFFFLLGTLRLLNIQAQADEALQVLKASQLFEQVSTPNFWQNTPSLGLQMAHAEYVIANELQTPNSQGFTDFLAQIKQAKAPWPQRLLRYLKDDSINYQEDLYAKQQNTYFAASLQGLEWQIALLEELRKQQK